MTSRPGSCRGSCGRYRCAAVRSGWAPSARASADPFNDASRPARGGMHRPLPHLSSPLHTGGPEHGDQRRQPGARERALRPVPEGRGPPRRRQSGIGGRVQHVRQAQRRVALPARGAGGTPPCGPLSRPATSSASRSPSSRAAPASRSGPSTSRAARWMPATERGPAPWPPSGRPGHPALGRALPGPAEANIADLIINHDDTLARWKQSALVMENGKRAGQMIYKHPHPDDDPADR